MSKIRFKGTLTNNSQDIVITGGRNFSYVDKNYMVWVSGHTLPLQVIDGTEATAIHPLTASIKLAEVYAGPTEVDVEFVLIVNNHNLVDLAHEVETNNLNYTTWFNKLDFWLNETGTIKVNGPSGETEITTLFDMQKALGVATDDINTNWAALQEASRTTKHILDWKAAEGSGGYYSEPNATGITTNAPDNTNYWVGFVLHRSPTWIVITVSSWHPTVNDGSQTLSYRMECRDGIWSPWHRTLITKEEQATQLLPVLTMEHNDVDGTAPVGRLVTINNMRGGKLLSLPSGYNVGDRVVYNYFNREGLEGVVASSGLLEATPTDVAKTHTISKRGTYTFHCIQDGKFLITAALL